MAIGSDPTPYPLKEIVQHGGMDYCLRWFKPLDHLCEKSLRFMVNDMGILHSYNLAVNFSAVLNRSTFDLPP